MMTDEKKRVDRRKHKRFQVPRYTAYAALRPHWPHSGMLGDIIDISRGGLAFRHTAIKKRSRSLFELKILLADGSFFLDRIPFDTISDIEVENELSLESVPVWRRSVQFGELTDSQTLQLEYFIQNHTASEGAARIASGP